MVQMNFSGVIVLVLMLANQSFISECITTRRNSKPKAGSLKPFYAVTHTKTGSTSERSENESPASTLRVATNQNIKSVEISKPMSPSIKSETDPPSSDSHVTKKKDPEPVTVYDAAPESSNDENDDEVVVYYVPERPTYYYWNRWNSFHPVGTIVVSVCALLIFIPCIIACCIVGFSGREEDDVFLAPRSITIIRTVPKSKLPKDAEKASPEDKTASSSKKGKLKEPTSSQGQSKNKKESKDSFDEAFPKLTV